MTTLLSKWKKRLPDFSFEDDRDFAVSLLKARGIDDYESFFNPDKSVLYNPLLLGNIREVCNIIFDAVKHNKKIGISADPDADGVFATATMVRYIRQFTDNYYILYHQRSEGHGVENQLDHIQEGTELLIILDSSTNSKEACKKIKEQGIRIVILDHHDFEEKNPYALIVNPKLDDTYPNKDISGAGVVFKVIQVLDSVIGTGMAEELIDLVGFGMYGDMMPVDILENRYLIIQAMQNIRNKGVLALLETQKQDLKLVNSQTIAFKITPLINGAARMDNIEIAIELLLNDNYAECMQIAKEMKELNEKRRVIEKELFENYVEQLDHSNKILVTIDDNASKNFNGLVANKIAQEFKKPAIVMRRHKGTLAGSYRSYANLDLKSVFNGKTLKKNIKYALGHPGAGGISLAEKNLDKFLELVNGQLSEESFDQSLFYDVEIDADQITDTLIEEAEKFDYLTGQNFPGATFKVNNVLVEDEPVIMGKNRDTVKFNFNQFSALKFKTNEHFGEDIDILDRVDLIGQLQFNVFKKWSGAIEITNQVILEDISKRG